MEYNQKINCTVTSCAHNDERRQECRLGQIIVVPKKDINTAKADESMCSSYNNIKK